MSLKRTGWLDRRTPLARSLIKRKQPMSRGDSQLRRTPIRKVSAKRLGQRSDREAVRAFVLSRDEHRCQLAQFFPTVKCFGRMTVHHLRKASQGGPYLPSNLVAACVRHNDLVEDEPTAAKAAGLVR